MPVNWRNVQGEQFSKSSDCETLGPHYNRHDMQICSKAQSFFALLLFVLPAGVLPRLNTANKQELQRSVERATPKAQRVRCLTLRDTTLQCDFT